MDRDSASKFKASKTRRKQCWNTSCAVHMAGAEWLVVKSRSLPVSVTGEGDRDTARAGEDDATSSVSFGANIRDFFAWWRQELVSLTPGGWRNSLQTRGPVASVQEVDGQLVLKTKPGVPGVPLVPGGKTPRGISRAGVVYILSEDAALRRERRLPAASRAHVQNIMNLQMASDTPFTIDEVYADSIVTGEDDAAREIIVSQALAPRGSIDVLVDELYRGYGIRLSAIDLADRAMPMGRVGYNLLPPSMRPAVKSGGSAGIRILGLVLVGAAVFAGFAWRDLQQRRIAAADTLIETAEVGAAEAMQISTRVTQGIGGIEKLAAEQADPLGFLRVYNIIASLLPDGSWLEEFAYERPTVTVTGLSGNSATLVEAFEASDAIAGARFASPVVRDSQTGAERFRLEITFKESRGPVDETLPAAETEQ
jgi:general secretion pathway protein L